MSKIVDLVGEGSEVWAREFQNGTTVVRAATYPWRELSVGEEFDCPYCPRCVKALIKQAEKSTRRKFEIVTPQVTSKIRRIS